MLRISKLSDYGTLVLVHLAGCSPERQCPASDVAQETRLALPTVQKVLKTLARGGLVVSSRGADGGYRLARPAEDITAAEILDVLEGPVAITECSHTDGHCELEPNCQVGSAWQKISRAIHSALSEVTLRDLQQPPAEFPLRNMILNESGHSNRPQK